MNQFGEKISYLMPERVKKLRLVNEAVYEILVRSVLLESAEHPVPDDQDASIVFIQAIAVGPWK